MSVPSDSISAGGTLAINRLPFDLGAEHPSYPASAFPSCGHAFPLAYRRCVPCIEGIGDTWRENGHGGQERNKGPFFDRDLNNFRLLFDLRAIDVNVIGLTRCLFNGHRLCGHAFGRFGFNRCNFNGQWFGSGAGGFGRPGFGGCW